MAEQRLVQDVRQGPGEVPAPKGVNPLDRQDDENSASAAECWVVTEGIAGMESQCLGLAEHLPYRVRIFRLTLKQPWRLLAPFSLGSPFNHILVANERPQPPWPKLLIACGRQSIPFAREVKRASGGKTFLVQCQDPRVDPGLFDLVIAPEHDEIKGPTVFAIIGSTNRVTPDKLNRARNEFAALFEPLRAPRVAVLVGGRSRTHGTVTETEARKLANALTGISASHGVMLSTSRRTGPASARILRQALDGRGAFIWDNESQGANPYLGMLAWADAFVVTGDSVNMVCEAATTGKPVHVVALPGARPKSLRFHRALRKRGITRPFEGRIEQWSYTPLDESARAAAEIKRRLDVFVTASDMNG